MRDGSGTIVWLRQDLRVTDNPALHAALERGGAVFPCYIWAPEEEGKWPPGAASRWWLHQSLTNLDASLRKKGSRLIVRRGPTMPALRELLQETGADAVFWNRRYEPAATKRDQKIHTSFQDAGIEVEHFSSALLYEPGTVLNRQGEPYRVFTPFWKTCQQLPPPEPPKGAPRRIKAPRRWPASLTVQDLELEPTIDWAGGIRESWQPGERGAARRLRRFIRTTRANYHLTRDRPDLPGTSRLSPHLHFGEISVRQIWSELFSEGRSAAAKAVRVFASELGWREFAHHLLFHFPHTAEQPLRDEFARFPWKPNARQRLAWERGRTGFPIVDAGMRELWHTGWMHNRVRMIVASFLIKDLLIPWQEGAAWFWDTLVDADLANNTLGWQWSAGCGADAAPFFRIFNPVTQGKKFDPHGDYVRRWVSELGDVPADAIHQPWKAKLNTNYPNRIVEHDNARRRALAAFRRIRK